MHADTLIFKDGRTLDNVKVSVTQTHVLVTHENGRVTRIAKSEVRSLRRRPVRWTAKQEPPPDNQARALASKRDEAKLPTDSQESDRDSEAEANASQDADRPDEQPPTNPLLWSAVFPGLGHFNQGRNIEGSVYIIGGLALAAAMAERYGTFLKYEGAYGDSSQLVGLSLFAPSGLRAASFYFALQRQQADRDAARRAASGIKTAAGLFAALYVWNLVDIAFLGDSQSVRAGAGPGAFYVSYRRSF